MTRSRGSWLLALLAGSLPAYAGETTVAPAGGSGASPPEEEAAECRGQPFRGAGTVYYYCDCGTGAAPGCTPGDDSNRGTSPAAPRRTFADAAVRFNSMSAGESVAMCRGGAWDEAGQRIGNPRCRVDDTCDWREYLPAWGSSSTPRPRLNAPGDTNVFYVGAGQGYRFWNLDIRNKGGLGFSFYLAQGGPRNVDVCNVNMQDGYIGFNDASNWNPPTDGGIVLRHSRMSGFKAYGSGGGSTNLTIDHNHYLNNGIGDGAGGLLFHSHYFGSSGGRISNARFTSNEVRTDARCNGVMVVVHAMFDDMLIENNLIVNAGGTDHCAGIWVSGGAAFEELFRAVIRRNRVVMTGAGSNLGGSEAIHVSACHDCTISDNLASMAGYNGITIGTERAGGTSSYTTATVVQNNTVYITNPHGAQGIALGPSAQGKTFVVENNAIWALKRGPCIGSQPGVAFLRQESNYCRLGSGHPVGEVFVDAPNGNFKPTSPGPLVGKADPKHHSPRSIGSVTWTPGDPGLPRRPPVDIGAFQR